MRLRFLLRLLVVPCATALTAGRVAASIPAPDGTYTGCYGPVAGALRVIDATAGKRCFLFFETMVPWNAPGPAGPQGPIGPQGSQGPQGAQGTQGAPGGAPLCRGRPGGTCSASTGRSCAYDADCPGGEQCGWSQPFARFVDNGNGTVTDRRTCLQWEKKTWSIGASDLHDVSAVYTWSATDHGPFDGTAEAFVAQLNGEAFAGHTDWRLPTSSGLGTTGDDPQLESIAAPARCDLATNTPCIDPIFGPTDPAPYLSASTTSSGGVWFVEFKYSGGTLKWDTRGLSGDHVRAVRGGPGVP